MEIELGRIFRAIKRYWWVVISSAIVFAVLAGLFWTTLPRTYTASSVVMVLPSSVSGDSITDTGSPVNTYIELITSEGVLVPVMLELGEERTLEEFRNALSVEGISGTSMIRISVTDDDPERAAEINALVTNSFNLRADEVISGVRQTKRDDLIYERDQLDTQIATINAKIDQLTEEAGGDIGSNDQIDKLKEDRLYLEQLRASISNTIRSLDIALVNQQSPVVVADYAVPPERSNGTPLTLLLAVGVMFGGLIGAFLMIWLELRDSGVRDEQHLRELLGVDSITTIENASDTAEERADLNLVSARIAGLARKREVKEALFVTARDKGTDRTVADNLRSLPQFQNLNVTTFFGLLDNGVEADVATQGVPATVFVELGKTNVSDVQGVLEILNDIGAVTSSGVLVKA